MNKLKLIAVLAVAILVAVLVPAANADSVTFTATGTDGDGPLAATLVFNAVSGGIDVTVTNTETGTIAQGQGISAFTFSVGTLGAPTAFTELKGETFTPTSGTAWTLASGTAFDTVSGPPNHGWSFSATCGPSGSAVGLGAAGGCSGGGQPQDLIEPGAATAGSGSSDTTHCQPCLIGPTEFFLTDSGVTSGTLLENYISNVQVGFGTGPDATVTAVTTPEPSTSMLLGIGLLGLLGLRRKQIFG